MAPARIPHLSTCPCDGSRTGRENLASARSPANVLQKGGAICQIVVHRFFLMLEMQFLLFFFFYNTQISKCILRYFEERIISLHIIYRKNTKQQISVGTSFASFPDRSQSALCILFVVFFVRSLCSVNDTHHSNNHSMNTSGELPQTCKIKNTHFSIQSGAVRSNKRGFLFPLFGDMALFWEPRFLLCACCM